MSDLIQFGVYFEEFIKGAAGLLANDGWAGLICWVLLISKLVMLSHTRGGTWPNEQVSVRNWIKSKVSIDFFLDNDMNCWEMGWWGFPTLTRWRCLLARLFFLVVCTSLFGNELGFIVKTYSCTFPYLEVSVTGPPVYMKALWVWLRACGFAPCDEIQDIL